MSLSSFFKKNPEIAGIGRSVLSDKIAGLSQKTGIDLGGLLDQYGFGMDGGSDYPQSPPPAPSEPANGFVPGLSNTMLIGGALILGAVFVLMRRRKGK